MIGLIGEEDSESPGVGGNRRRDGDIGGSTGLANVSGVGRVRYGVDGSTAARNEDPIHFIQNIYVRLGGTGGAWVLLTMEGGAISFEFSSV